MKNWEAGLLIICVLSPICLSGCVEDDETDATVMTFGELIDDYNQNVENETKTITEGFTSLDDGDILVIRDTITNISYDEAYDITSIEFASVSGESLSVTGNITGEFETRDRVELELHIIKVNFTETNPYTSDLWTFELETMQEGWDNQNNTYIPFPQNVIRQISGDNVPATMTFLQFTEDYKGYMDNETRTLTYDFQSLFPGDTLIIRDVINNVTYNASKGYSNIEFASAVGSDNSFPIQGDITGEFMNGDTVELELHIISVNFTDYHPYTGEEWSIEMETFREGWNNETNTAVIVPQSHLRHG